MHEHRNVYIGGDWVSPSGTATIEVVSPVTDEVVGVVPDGTPADVDKAVETAAAAFASGEWSGTPPEERIAAVQRFCDAYAARMIDMADLITEEIGSPVSFSRLAQGPGAWAIIDAAVKTATAFPWEEERTGYTGGTVVVRNEPVGVVAAIVPWNTPQYVTMTKLAPALLAGCSVVLKPSPETPLDAYLMAEILDRAGLPPGVVSVVPAGREVGEHLVTHPLVDKVAFTGSTAAGRRIAALCGERLTRVSLELGGKSAAIVLDDADLAALTEALPMASFPNGGQGCVTQSRLLAPRSRYDEVLDAVASTVAGFTVGDPTDPATTIGPMASRRHQERVAGYIELGIEEGARVVTGGPGLPESVDRGAYVRPTVFADVDNSMRIAQEEIFGPVLSVIPYDDEDDAVRIANDSIFGLSGSVWTTDPDRAMRVARRVRTGTFGFNKLSADQHAPFGGFKCSGLGREFGAEGQAEYTELKTILP